MQKQQTLKKRLIAAFEKPVLAPLNAVESLDLLVGMIRPNWSLREIRARVIQIVARTADTKSFVLEPNANWPGHRAGEHVLLTVEIDGRRVQRAYSLSSAPGPAGETVEITVKRQPNGLVSNWLHDELRVGDVLSLEAPSGNFVLPESRLPKLLMVSAGSGITPLMSMLRVLAAQDPEIDVTLVHSCREPADFIFGEAVQELTARMPSLRVIPRCTAQQGRLSATELPEMVADYAERETYVCGPAGLIDAVTALWAERKLGARLQSERFTLAAAIGFDDSQAAVDVRCAKSERSFIASSGASLLEQAEAAGLKPRYGCRIGICQTCKCRKTSGTVQNLLTGQVSSEPNEMIQLCISAPRSDLNLDL